jgi:propanol-preferring alcohol dehydrogenase
MRAMALTRPGGGTLEPVDYDVPAPGQCDILVRVLACGVCRTDLHVVAGDLPSRRSRSSPVTRLSGVWNASAMR